MAQKLLFLFSFLAFFQVAPAQDSQAESLFNNAATFMAAGKFQDALTDYQTIVDNYADSGWADKALLAIGHFYQYNEKNLEEALVYYTKIKETYPRTDSAPSAYFSSSMIRESLATNRVELDSAGNDLVRMIGLYPDSGLEADALFLMGKINFRLGNLNLAQSFLQKLLLYYPQSDSIPWSFILRAKIAYYSGQKDLALEILSRMQTYFSKDPLAFEESRQMGRLIERMKQPQIEYTLDRSFPASTPKTFKSPTSVQVDGNGLIAIVDSNGIHFMARESEDSSSVSPQVLINAKDLVELNLDTACNLVFGTKTQILTLTNGKTVQSPVEIDELISFTLDDFGRYYVLEDKQNDTLIYDRKGTFLRKLGVEKMKLIRCRDQEIWILDPDGDNLVRFSLDIKNLGNAASFDNVKDFCFDVLGNLYVIYNKGSRLAVLNRQGERKADLDFKTGSFPLRIANSVAVDKSGSIYLVDSKGGAVYRFF